VAARAGVSQPFYADIERGAHDTGTETLERILASSGHRLFVIPTTAHSAAEWADYIFQELRGNRRSQEVAFRALIGLNDDLRRATPALRVVITLAVPPLCGDAHFDAAVAALCEYRLSEVAMPLPEWINEPTRTLEHPWTVTPYAAANEVHPIFRRHGVILATSELQSV